MAGTSLGMIETWGYTAAVTAADAGTKAANVALLGFRHTSPALVAVVFTGDVAAVQTAVHAGCAAAAQVGQVVARLIIPRPDRQLSGSLRNNSPVAPSQESPCGAEQPEQQPGPSLALHPDKDHGEECVAQPQEQASPAQPGTVPAGIHAKPLPPVRKRKKIPARKKRAPLSAATTLPETGATAAEAAPKTLAASDPAGPQPKTVPDRTESQHPAPPSGETRSE